jgi:hypothetical protein
MGRVGADDVGRAAVGCLRDPNPTLQAEENTMSWFIRSGADGLAEATNEVAQRSSGGESDDLAVFALQPVEPAPPRDSLFAREVQIAAEPHPEDWESLHLLLM